MAQRATSSASQPPNQVRPASSQNPSLVLQRHQAAQVVPKIHLLRLVRLLRVGIGIAGVVLVRAAAEQGRPAACRRGGAGREVGGARAHVGLRFRVRTKQGSSTGSAGGGPANHLPPDCSDRAGTAADTETIWFTTWHHLPSQSGRQTHHWFPPLWLTACHTSRPARPERLPPPQEPP